MTKLIRLNESQKGVIAKEMETKKADCVTLNGKLKMSNASLPKFISGLKTTDDLYQAYEIFKSFNSQVKELKGYDKLIQLNKIHNEYLSSHQDLDKNVRVYIGKLLDSSQKSNLAGKLFTFQGIIASVKGKKIILKLVQEIYLGKQMLQKNELITVSTEKDFITDDDIKSVYGVKDKYVELFTELCSQINLDRKEFETFSEFVDNYKVEIDTQDKAYHDYMQSIIDDYLEF